VIRVPQYVASWKKKESDPRAEPTVVQDGPATALIDGKKGFGQIVAKRGMEVAMEKAAAIGVACVGVHNSNHIGRLADYTEMALERDMLSMLFVNAGGAGQRMAPWGGRGPRLSTNPLAFACPRRWPRPRQLRRGHHGRRRGEGAAQAEPKERRHPVGSSTRRGSRRPTPTPCTGSRKEASCRGRPQGLLPGYHGRRPGGDRGARGLLPRESRPGPERDLHGGGGHRAFVPAATFRAEVDDLIRYLKTSPPVSGGGEILYYPASPRRDRSGASTQRHLRRGRDLEARLSKRLGSLA